jgi:acetoin:2,6-dichlorophenolindophenol oxidoreductase subunit beta
MSETLTLSQAYRAGVREEMARDERIFIMGTDILLRGGHFAQVKGLGDEFGSERVRDTPISEAAMVAAGVGAALCGMRPIVDLNFLDFAFGAMDEICNQAAKIRYMFGMPVPLVIRATNGIAYGGAQHNNAIAALFAEIPGMSVAVPSTPADTKGLIKTALRLDDPVMFLMDKLLTGLRGPVDGPEALVPFGRAAIRRSGRDVTVVTHGAAVGKALQAAERLSSQGVEVEVIDLRTLAPLDRETVVESVRRTGRAIVVDEAPGYGGLGAEIAASIQETAFEYLDAPVLRVTGAYSPIPQSTPLLEAAIPQVAAIEAGVHAVMRQG